jgi:septum formation protein
MSYHPELILASSSPRRSELLRSLNLDFQIQISDVDEAFDPRMKPAEVVEELSFRKANKVAGRMNQGIVIGSDTIVYLDGVILGKPADEEDAFQMLSKLQGRTHEVYTGVTCMDASRYKVVTGHRKTYVTMRQMSVVKIRDYIATGEPMGKAGAYAIQGYGAIIVERIEGCYFNVVGLPLFLLSDQLEQFNIFVFPKN